MLNKTENPCLNLILRTVRRISSDVLKSLIRAYEQFRNYKLKDLPSDLSTGLAVAVLLVPQNMTYALLGGLRPIYGLYVSTVPLVVYTLFGASRHLSVVPPALMALLIFTGVSTIAEPGSDRYV